MARWAPTKTESQGWLGMHSERGCFSEDISFDGTCQTQLASFKQVQYIITCSCLQNGFFRRVGFSGCAAMLRAKVRRVSGHQPLRGPQAAVTAPGLLDDFPRRAGLALQAQRRHVGEGRREERLDLSSLSLCPCPLWKRQQSKERE